MPQIVQWMDELLMDPDNEQQISAVGTEVNKFMRQFPLYPEMG
jgi:glycine hydroxymethyltransferase